MKRTAITRRLFATGMLLLAMLLSAQASSTLSEVVAARAWFTDAEFEGSIRIVKPRDPLPAVRGSFGRGVRLTRSVPIEDPLLRQDTGMISFWLRPDWDGDDGKTHRILRIGDPEVNGLLVEKSAQNMLRFVMASPKKMTASRADVSGWRAGEWHHVVVSWFSYDGKPLGLPLWIDKIAVDGPIAGGNEFLNPDTMKDKRMWIGDESSEAVMDELIMRDRSDTERMTGEKLRVYSYESRDSHPKLQRGTVYRDYFRTAPFTSIEITHEALFTRSDRRVVEGHEKQFGLLAKLEGKMVPVTDYAVRYSQWGEYDAKPFITWKMSDEFVASIDENGMATGKSVGRCRLTAEFRGMKDSYIIRVVPVDRSDLDLLYVERLPRYSWKRAKWNPEPGEKVESVAHVANFGFKPAAAGALVRFELLPDSNRNFVPDPGERAVMKQEKIIKKTLAPLEETSISFSWKWTDKPVFVRVTVDCRDVVPEICEVNNQRCDLNIARPMRYAYEPFRLEDYYNGRQMNHVGSFSYYDWIHAQCERLNLVLRETILQCTSPVGIQDALRVDKIYPLKGDDWEKVPFATDPDKEEYYDGGWPIQEPVKLMATDPAILHEYGHRCLYLPDLYSYPVRIENVLLKDEKGELYAGSEVLPAINKRDLMMPSTCCQACGVGYKPLMHENHLWLQSAHAGQIQHFAGYRGHRWWGAGGRLIPTHEHILEVYDVYDRPLVGASVYVYHVTQAGHLDAGAKFFIDRPKFIGNTNEDGRYTFPYETDKDWDDPDTDEVEGEFKVWNPFGRAHTLTGTNPDVAFTSNVWQTEGLLLIKVVCEDQVEFQWLPVTVLNEAFFNGNRIRGVYPIRTSLLPSSGETAIVRREIPEPIRDKNLRPIAVAVEELSVKTGGEFTIDGSKSHDPEGQSLYYRWAVRGQGVEPDHSTEQIFKAKVKEDAKDFEVAFWVIDGIRASDPALIKVKVLDGEETQ